MKPSFSPNPGHEHSDASLRLIAIMAASLVVGIGASLLIARAVVKTGRPAAAQAEGLGARGAFVNGPDRRTGIEQAWSQIDAQTQEHLHTYGWIDRSAGIVRIPIDRAMDLMAARSASSSAAAKGNLSP